MIINFIEDLKKMELPKNVLEFENSLNDFKKQFFHEYKNIYIESHFAAEDMVQLEFTEEKLRFSFANIYIILEKIDSVLIRFREQFPPMDPDFVIFFGFFSPDGFLMSIEDKWYPTICLDRFFDYFKIESVAAHELGHYFFKNSGIKYDLDKEEIFANYLSTKILKTCYNNVIFDDGKAIPMISNSDRFWLDAEIRKTIST
ncbi:hypothetical protein J7L48_04795 [bacterium]|nr:hypothetical protein [bacterium]